jgi:hypothetical protein
MELQAVLLALVLLTQAVVVEGYVLVVLEVEQAVLAAAEMVYLQHPARQAQSTQVAVVVAVVRVVEELLEPVVQGL